MKVFVALALIALVGASLVEGRSIRDLKSTLITKGNDLLKKADEAVKKLEAEHHAHEVTVVKHEEAAIKKLISEVTAETDATKLTHLEHQLAQAEHRLEFELVKISHMHTRTTHAHHTHAPTTVASVVVAKRDLKSTLLTKAKELLTKADEEIKKLTAAKQTHEVTVIQHEEEAIKKLVAAVEAETDPAKLKHLEHELLTAEHKLHTELQKIEHHKTHAPHTTHAHVSHTHASHAPTTHAPATHAPTTVHAVVVAKRDLKSTLLAKAKTLLAKADEEIKKLTAAHKTHEVTVIQHEEAAIKKLVAAVEAETDAAKLTHLEHQLTTAEHKLQTELQKIEHHGTHPTHAPHSTHAHVSHTHAPTTVASVVVAKRDLKSSLLAKAKTLLAKADEEIKKLTAAHHAHEATVIQHEEAAIKKLVAQVEAETDTAKLTHLEHQLVTAEHKLQTELLKIEHQHNRTTHAHHTHAPTTVASF